MTGLGDIATNRYPTFYCGKLMKYFARGGDTVVAATNDYQLLSACAVRRTNGCLTLLVVNKSSYASLSAAINLAGYVPFSNATVYSYGIPQDDAARTGVGSQDIAQTNSPVAGANFNYTFAPYSATVLALTPAAPSLAVPALPRAARPVRLPASGPVGGAVCDPDVHQFDLDELDCDFHQHAGGWHAQPHQHHVVRRTVLSRGLAPVSAAERAVKTAGLAVLCEPDCGAHGVTRPTNEFKSRESGNRLPVFNNHASPANKPRTSAQGRSATLAGPGRSTTPQSLRNRQKTGWRPAVSSRKCNSRCQWNPKSARPTGNFDSANPCINMAQPAAAGQSPSCSGGLRPPPINHRRSQSAAAI